MGLAPEVEYITFPAAGADFGVMKATWNNAATLALPTTGISLMPAVAGKIIVPEFCIVRITATAGAYTNVNAAAFANFHINGIDQLAFIANDAALTTPAAFLTALLTNAAINISKAGLLQQPDDTASAWGILATTHTPTSSITNQPFTFKIDNAGAGNLTGGNGANTGEAWTRYLMI